MSIRVRMDESNDFPTLKILLEKILLRETDTTSYVIDYEFQNSLHKSFLAQVFTSVFTEVFVGSGLDDATSGGIYTGAEDARFVIEIDATGAPDTFKWSKDGVEQANGVSIIGGAMVLMEGVTITFAATTGHTATDIWTIDVMRA